MRKITTLISSLLISTLIYGQLPPAGGPGGGAFWRKGGNTAGNGANKFGTFWNSPIYTYTAGVNRLRLNGNVAYTVNQVNKSFSGYMGIGPTGYFATHTPLAYLHLEGPNNTGFVGNGWRAWMETGVFMKRNSDAMYVGLLDLGYNRADAIINWSDDPTGGNNVDKLRFIFTAVAANGNGDNNNPKSGSSKYGYEFMRMVPSPYQTNSAGSQVGYIGIGPVFDNIKAPRSRVHINSEDRLYTWLQITNQNGTGQTANDGLRIGIRGGNNASGYLRWQEYTPFIIQTDWNTTPGGINNGERMRITTVNAPGVPNPAAPFSKNTTRVAISHLGSAPVTKPRSLLHLGYNTGKLSFGGPDGWRKWMDIGMFISNGTDNGYFGLKEEKGQNNDRFDMVINWGDNQVAGNSVNGPDNLRFIFTSTTTALPPGQGDPVSQSYDGLEIARMAPGKASTMPTSNYGMVGIGNFAPGSANAPGTPAYIDAKLDIDGDLRIRTVTEDSLSEFVLVIDTSDYNRVHYRKLSTLGGGGFGGFGNICGGTLNSLPGDWEVNMNHNDLFFTNNGNINIGNVYCGSPQIARVFIRHTYNYATQTPVGLWVETTASGYTGAIKGMYANANGGTENYAGYFEVIPNFGSTFNVGVYASAPASGNNPPTGPNYAGYFAGDVLVTGSALVQNSDSIIKQNIQPLQSALSIINQLKPRSFEYTTDPQYTTLNLQPGTHYGLIAQDVETVLPDIVTTTVHPAQYDSAGNQVTPAITLKGIRYGELTAYLIAGIKEQQTQLDSMQQALAQKDSLLNEVFARLSALENCVDNANLCSMDARTGNPAGGNDFETSVELNNLPGIILDQNVPNPFAENTVITFTIPEEVSEASLIFYDTNGRVIKTTLIHERGNGKMVVYGENLSSGIYTYALVADGKVIATKQMVKTE